MIAYRVMWGGEPKGPYGLVAIEKLIDRGAVTADTQISPAGSERWSCATDFPDVARLLLARVAETRVSDMSAPETGVAVPETVVISGALVTSSAPGQMPGLVQPPPSSPGESSKSKRVRLLLIAVAVGGVLLAMAVAGVLLFMSVSREAAFPEVVLGEALPSQVQRLVAMRVPSPDDVESVRGLRISSLAGLCGGSDVGARLLSAPGKTADALLGDGTLSLLQGDQRRAGLLCAQGILTSMQSSHFVYVTFDDGDDERTVALLPLGEIADPPFSLAHNFSGLDGRCSPDADSPSECGPEYSAAVQSEGWWAFGRGAAVAAFARQWNRGSERSETTNMEYARLLGERVGVNSRISGVFVRPAVLPFVDMCESVPGGVVECLPDEVADTITRIQSSIRAVSIDIRVPDPDQFDPVVSWTMSFAARDEDDAEDVSRDLDELLRDWRAHLDNREATLVQRIRDTDADDMDRQEAMLRAFVRAMSEAEVQVDGRVARIVAEDELSEAEQREVNSYLDAQRALRQAASRVVLAMLASEAPERADLNGIVGVDAAAWMLEPRASRETCDRVRGRIEALSAPGMPPQDFGALFRLGQQFAVGSCAGAVMPGVISECLIGAASATVMEACPVAVPSWRPQPVRQILEGTLVDDDQRVVDDQSPYDDLPVQLNAGWTLTVDMVSEDFDAYLWLLDPEGLVITRDDDGGTGMNARIQFTVPTPGQYVVRANSYSRDGRGAYTVTVRAQ